MQNTKGQFYTAEEAAQRLGVTKSTLYSYVSRGLVRSVEGTESNRSRRYLADDIRQLVEKKSHKQNPDRVAQRALRFGAPVLESAITSIDGEQLYYRGISALQLAQEYSFEAVASLLWSGKIDDRMVENVWQDEQPTLNLIHEVETWFDRPLSQRGELKPIERFQVMLPLMASLDLPAYHLEPKAVTRTGARILQVMTYLVTGSITARPIAQQLCESWGLHSPEAQRLINAALILSADHELNVSTFTARCVASAGSTPYAAIVAGLSAIQGYNHGGHTELVDQFLDEAKTDLQGAIRSRLNPNGHFSGFGHPLYPNGDPRGQLLLQMISDYFGESEELALANRVMDMVHDVTEAQPNVDFALTVLCRVLGLPKGTALTLFTIGRSAGWLGHCLEQYRAGQLIRPRAHYIGPPPLSEGKTTHESTANRSDTDVPKSP